VTTELRLPQLADSVTSVRLSVWLKQEGDRVQAGEPIVEVETDKTNVEIESPASGVVREIQVAAGTDGVEAGTLLAIIADDPAGETVTPAATAAAPVPDNDQGSETAFGGAVAGQGEQPAAQREAARQVQISTPVSDGAPAPVATPIARRMAAAAGLDLSIIRGTGRGGRIGKADIDRVLAAQRTTTPAASVEALAPAPVIVESRAPAGPDGPFQEQPLTAMRRITATRMQQAKQTVPHFYLRVECAADAALGLVATAKKGGADVTPTLTDVVIRAAAFALRQVPQANSTWADGVVRVYDDVDIALAVNTEKGLITPIVRGADRKGLGAIARETRALVARAREGTLKPEEYSGGTITISNLGMYGIESLYAIVNPPQSCILGIGAAIARPIVAGTVVTVGTVMACTLSADHRVLDGAVGAELLAAFKDYIEHPGLMAV
jgi:pyruvate dehydrogenase E2 component (dihydrolipoamide acetyltransferase)